MKRSLLVLLLLSQHAFAQNVSVQKDCVPFDQARADYFSGQKLKSIAELECLKKQNPHDLDVRRLLSDIHWWSGYAELSEQEAKEIVTSQNFQSGSELDYHLAPRLHPWQMSVRGETLQGQAKTTQTGFEGTISIAYRDQKKNHYGVSASHLTRAFGESDLISDHSYGLAYSAVTGSASYVETQVDYAPDGHFLPQVSASVEPHLVLEDDSDISLSYRHNHYLAQDVGIVSAQWTKPVNDTWTPAVRVYGVLSDTFLPSFQASILYAFNFQHSIKIYGAGGKTLEAAHVENDFSSTSAVYGYRFNSVVTLRLLGSSYRSSFRSENRIGLGVDWIM